MAMKNGQKVRYEKEDVARDLWLSRKEKRPKQNSGAKRIKGFVWLKK